jgi:hypothetical protein
MLKIVLNSQEITLNINVGIKITPWRSSETIINQIIRLSNENINNISLINFYNFINLNYKNEIDNSISIYSSEQLLLAGNLKSYSYKISNNIELKDSLVAIDDYDLMEILELIVK